jgi:hypothetical protein
VTAEAERILETAPVRRPIEYLGKKELRTTRADRGAERVERVRPIGAQAGTSHPLPNPRPAGGSEEFESMMEAVYERRQGFPPEEKGVGWQESSRGEKQGPAGTDLSLLCDRLFVSGLSSSRITTNGRKDDRDEG